MKDRNELAISRISSSIDRFQEAHFWMHNMEACYHTADHFRWCLNAFLRSIKEIPQILLMETQEIAEIKSWVRDKREVMESDTLLKTLAKKRDFVVHQSMLLPISKCSIGLTELRGHKFSISIPISAQEDSDNAIVKYLSVKTPKQDPFGILIDDEDTVPCVWREWRIKEFDAELVEVAASAWGKIGDILHESLKILGGEFPKQSLDCLHSKQNLQFKLYEREELKKLAKTL